MVTSNFWTFPPQEPSKNEGICGVASDFGPVHLNDVILLEWTPDGDPFRLSLACCGNGGTIHINATLTPWPVEFVPDLLPDLNSTNETWGCHFWNGRKKGTADNTVIFPYINLEGDEVVTWKATASSTSASSTTSLSPSTLNISDAPTGSSTSITASPQTSGQASNGLSLAASAGIGVAAGTVGLVVIGSLAYKYRRKVRPQAAQPLKTEPPLSTTSEESALQLVGLRPPPQSTWSHSSADGSSRQANGIFYGPVSFNS